MGSVVSELIDWIGTCIDQSNGRPPLLFVSGAQGIGKTTVLKKAQKHFDGRLAVLGLDDFYLTKSARDALARRIHPLFETRGPPGTHDIARIHETIDDLLRAKDDTHTTWPFFDKRVDERAPESDWFEFVGKPKAILLEGWMVGALPDPTAPLAPPINRIEASDTDGVWRRVQEDHLECDYAPLWDRADAYFHMRAPSFDQILGWRLQQEETTLGLNAGELPDDRKDWVETFILHYERLTRRMLGGGRRPGHVCHVNAKRKAYTPDSPTPLIVFSDLDGTLLDHETYSYRAAIPALDALKQRGAITVLASSKTAAEIMPLREELGLSHCPAIVENGAGYLAPYQLASDTKIKKGTHPQLIEALESLPEALREAFESFLNWTPKEIAKKTGLSKKKAKLAGKRQFSEPGLWTGDKSGEKAFLKALKAKGVDGRRGGRFLTLSFGATKGDQMDEIIAQFSAGSARPLTMALGDAPNDVEMIAKADRGVIIANSGARPIERLEDEAKGHIQRTLEEGPAGWNKAVLEWLHELDN